MYLTQEAVGGYYALFLSGIG